MSNDMRGFIERQIAAQHRHQMQAQFPMGAFGSGFDPAVMERKARAEAAEAERAKLLLLEESAT